MLQVAKLEAISKALRGESCEQIVLNTYAIINYKPNCEPLISIVKYHTLFQRGAIWVNHRHREHQCALYTSLHTLHWPMLIQYADFFTIGLELCILSPPKRNLGSCKLCSIASLLYRFHAKARYAWELGSTNPILVMLGKIMGSAHICHLMPHFVLRFDQE
jgi:hypothetical protein